MKCSSGVWAGLAFGVIFVGSIALMVGVTYNHRMAAKRNYEWWERSVIYHIFTPSFYDTDDDGFGDLRGIGDKLDYIVDLGVDSVFLSAFYEFGGVDMGYDVVNHMAVDPIFGTNKDLDALLHSLDEKGLKLIVDFVPNHTSKKHEWFEKSISWNNEGQGKYKDYYIWRNASNWESPGEDPKPPNAWMTSVPNLPAWSWDATRKQYYLHTLLPDMPDLNLDNEDVRTEIKEIFKFWLSKSPIFGVRIGAFNLLFEDDSDQTTEVIKSDVEATLEFLDELRDIAEVLADADGTKRLFLVEMLQTENLMKWQETYRNATLERGNVIPFNLGILPWKNPNLSGDDVHQSVQDYIAAIPQEEVEKRANALLSWEMDNHDKFAVADEDSSRMPDYLNEVGMMITMLLPGTMMIYYGDEIGMSDSDAITCEQTQDPYAIPPYGSECIDFPQRSRDPGRAPMQWKNDTYGGFSDSEPWLPLSSKYLDVNVEIEMGKENSKLHFFKNLLKIRQEDPIYHGEVFYPYHDKNIFSFLRMEEDTKIGLLVVVNIHEFDDIEVDIHSVMPGVPNEGTVRLVTSSDVVEEANYEMGSSIELNEILLSAYQGLVIEVDFNPSEEEEH
ncbi:maltase 2-like [Tigriopus californicus]|uniref:maltase 2-like n=1 Tax=Tigriopus californicus TaxID=6832 RepID=UPI0027DA9B24|nr:maltase 2-like [Tigriopus californicus]